MIFFNIVLLKIVIFQLNWKLFSRMITFLLNKKILTKNNKIFLSSLRSFINEKEMLL